LPTRLAAKQLVNGKQKQLQIYNTTIEPSVIEEFRMTLYAKKF